MKQIQQPVVLPAPEMFSDAAPTTDSNPGFADAAPAQLVFVRKTLAELGANLPVGIKVGDKQVRPFRLRPFRLKEEKAVSRLKEDAKGMTIGKFVIGVLSTMVATVGPHNFDSMKEQERVLVLSQLTVADVLYLYLYLRYEALGPSEPVVMKVTCPSCHTDYVWYGDLGSLEVSTAPDGLVMDRDVQLRDGLNVRGGNRGKVRVTPLKWSVFMQPGFDHRGKRESIVIQHSICGADGLPTDVPLLLTENELDELTKYDLNALVADIELNSPGPHLKVEPQCSACNYRATMMMDWNYDSFFSRSVRPRPMTS